MGNTEATGRSRRRGPALAALVAALCTLALAPAAHAATAHTAGALSMTVDGLKGNKAQVLQKLTVRGQTTPSTPLTVTTTIVGQKPSTRQVSTNGDGAFSIPVTVNDCCTYKIAATTGAASDSVNFNVALPHLHPGSSGPLVAYFHTLLRQQGYYVHAKKRFNDSTGLAILAFRKVNRMPRQTKYNASIYKMLLQGRGAFPLQHGDAGKHVEADLSRQVLVLADGDKPEYTFPISSGKPSTPTVTGTYHFYLKVPGYNSERMYYSAFFIRGYATHGYVPVPNYAASHGCLRNPIPDSKFIYNWINIGDTIYVYH